MTVNFVLNPTVQVFKLTYNVLIEAEQQGDYKATVLGLPDCQITEKTREAALANLLLILDKRFQ